jgi:hypothetical protein
LHTSRSLRPVCSVTGTHSRDSSPEPCTPLMGVTLTIIALRLRTMRDAALSRSTTHGLQRYSTRTGAALTYTLRLGRGILIVVSKYVGTPAYDIQRGSTTLLSTPVVLPSLGVDDAGTRPEGSSEPHPHAFTYRVVGSLLSTIPALGPGVVERRRPRRQLKGSVLDGYSVGYALVAPGSSTCVAGLEYVPTAAPCTRVRGIGILRTSP